MANTTTDTEPIDNALPEDENIAEEYERIGSQVTSGIQMGCRPRRCVMRRQEDGLGGAIMQG